MFKKFLQPQINKRVKTLRDVFKYLGEKWLTKNAEKELLSLADQDRMCPSMFSLHSSPQEKNKLLNSLAKQGIETTVDRAAKKNRIRAWIQASTISEEIEEEDEENCHEDSLTTPSSFVPIGKNYLVDNSRKYIDPRTGLILNLCCQQSDSSFTGYQNCQEPAFFENKLVAYDNLPKAEQKLEKPKLQKDESRKSVRNPPCNSSKLYCSNVQQEIIKKPHKEIKRSSISESILKVKEKSEKKSHGRRVNIKTDSPIMSRRIVISSDLLRDLKSEDSDDQCPCDCQKNFPANEFDSDSIPGSSNSEQKSDDFDTPEPLFVAPLKDTPYDRQLKNRVYKKYNHS
jgi:hypothetical protein